VKVYTLPFCIDSTGFRGVLEELLEKDWGVSAVGHELGVHALLIVFAESACWVLPERNNETFKQK